VSTAAIPNESNRSCGPGADDERFIFNLVWTEGAFEYLGLFTMSLLANSGARFRFVANGCDLGEVDRMERFATHHPGRITDVMIVATGETLRHGDALDEVRDHRDDGAFFCFVDPDILATNPFLGDFARVLETHDAVTSGRELWADDNVVPEGHLGLNGEYFFRSDGYVYGSPHFAMYDAAALDEVTARWEVGFGSGGGDDALRQRLRDAGHDFLFFDTGKVVNILMQEQGHRLHHMEHEQLVHVGGLLHYLWAPRVEGDDGEVEVDWASWGDSTARHEVARYAAHALRNLLNGLPAPDLSSDSAALRAKLSTVRDTITELVAAYGEDWLDIIGRRPGPERAAASSYHALKRAAPRRRPRPRQ
jgi:hypothetical protein